MAKMEYFRDPYGNTATIKAESSGTLYQQKQLRRRYTEPAQVGKQSKGK